jgi:DNA-3-methyladenine glycosylase
MQSVNGPILPRNFYARPTTEVAHDLLGCVLEVEAYLGMDDLAAHASRGITPRTRVIFGSPGHAYVYFIYGMHECLNVTAEPDGTAGCVLIRALEPLAGIDLMRERRGRAELRDLTSGPGKLTVAMGITRKLNGVDLTKGPLMIFEGHGRNFEVKTTPRIGINQCVDWPLRFHVKNNRFVSRAR